MEEKTKLTIKYFLEQKAVEIIRFMICLIIIVFYPYLTGYFIFSKYTPITKTLNFVQIYLLGLIISSIIIIFIIMFFILYYNFLDFIKENWWKAEERAYQTLKQQMKGGKEKE